MQVGDVLFGFEVESCAESARVGGRLWELRHAKTGARVAWADNGKLNKLFSIAFKTVPEDNTGVFHILEHTVLNGSALYPVKEPFVELLKSSMNTFLNAFTMPDRTVFPVASRNEADFMNLTRVYLDAVFRPNIYQNKGIFMQEGWRVEFDEAGEPSFSGVVYNEMKGAYAPPLALASEKIFGELYPDSSYRFAYGGWPAEIPELTYEAFLAAHQKFYHPANSYVYLDGALPLERVLELLDAEYFAAAAPNPEEIELPLQPAAGGRMARAQYQAEEGEGAYLALGKIACPVEEREQSLAVLALCNYLAGSNEAPLKKAVLESGLAEDVQMFVEESFAQVPAIMLVSQLQPGKHAEFLDVLRGVREQILRDGLDEERLATVLERMEFDERNVDEPAALQRMMCALNTWMRGLSPLAGIDMDSVIAGLRAKVGTPYFTQLFEALTCDDGICQYLLEPSPTKGAEDEAAEAERARAFVAALTPEQLAALKADNAAMREWQEAEDTPEQLATLPRLALTDVEFAIPPHGAEWNRAAGTITHEDPADGIVRVELYFPLGALREDELPHASFLTNLLGELPTAKHTAAELEQLANRTFGELDFNVTCCDESPSAPAFAHLYVSMAVLEEKLPAALELMAEILTQTQFAGPEAEALIEMNLAQCVEHLRQSTLSAGHTFARKRALSHFSPACKMMDAMAGYTFFEWLQGFAAEFAPGLAAFQQAMGEVQPRLFTAAGLTISASGADPAGEAFASFRAAFPQVSGPFALEVACDGSQADELIAIPSSVAYAVQAGKIPNFEQLNRGALRVLCTIIQFNYLWLEVRVKGGAYGCGIQVNDLGLATFNSYRDPNPTRSLEVFANTAEFVRAFTESEEAFDQYIISTLNALNPLLGPAKKQRREDGWLFAGQTQEQLDLICRQLETLTREDFQPFVQMFEELAATSARCTLGPAQE